MGLFGGKSILRAKILVTPGNEYNITFEKLHPQLQRAEYIRLILCYLAKVLFNFGSGEIFATSELLKEISFIQREDITKKTNIIKKAELSDLVKVVDVIKSQHQVYTIDLVFHSPEYQTAVTKFPLKAVQQQVVFSIPVLIQAVITKLDEEELGVLTKSLRTMYNAYNSGVSFSTLSNMGSVPNEAYLSSLLETKAKSNVEDDKEELKLAKKPDEPKVSEDVKTPLVNNKAALTGFILGLVSIFFAWIGIIPILAIVFSVIGLSTFDKEKHTGRWQAIVGLILGILYTLVYMNMYGYLD